MLTYVLFTSIYLGASSLALVATYPAFKRFTYWPQLVLGMAFNWGVFLGWSVNAGGILDLSSTLPFYIAGICWTLIYDTIYAHQDKHDDFALGLKSTALKFGEQTPNYLYGFSALMTTSLLIGGLQTSQTYPFYLSLAICANNLIRITKQLNINNVQSCAQAFKQNSQIGWILLTGIVLSTLVKSDNKPTEQTQPNENCNLTETSNSS